MKLKLINLIVIQQAISHDAKTNSMRTISNAFIEILLHTPHSTQKRKTPK